ncbi:MAG: ChaB family protein [Methylobacter sp.]
MQEHLPKHALEIYRAAYNSAWNNQHSKSKSLIYVRYRTDYDQLRVYGCP